MPLSSLWPCVLAESENRMGSADQEYLEAISQSDFRFDVLMHKPIYAIELYKSIYRLVGNMVIRQAS